jgi:ATP-dependent Lon protease
MVFFRKQEEQAPKAGQDLQDLRESLAKADFPEHVAAVAEKELERLEKTDPAVAEYSIGTNYLEYLLSLPWKKATEDNLDLKRAEGVLQTKHFGLGHVKERILEYLAVRTWCSRQQFSVLVVDDEEIARHNLEYVLRKEGYDVAAAANGREALEKARSQHFDIILTDLKMDQMDGIQLLESVKAVAPQIDVVIITGYATVSTAVDALKKGAAHYLSKPIQIEEVRQTVRHILDKKRVLQLTRGPVLCFAGPPGTGKTSIGQAIAEALGRNFIRISLAGMRDEADLRGHRRTYVGAMPGRVISELRRVGVKNPVFMLDEIDKIGQDFRGDPASVLLEILDPEQNSQFVDHFLDIPFDLSGAIFIATANLVDQLPAPLLDRLEVIPFSGYTENEKKEIARSHLIPKKLRENGLAGHRIAFTDEAIVKIIREHTKEAGLRNLEREIANVCRKLAKISLEDDDAKRPVTVDDARVETLLGARKFSRDVIDGQDRTGVATGLVWTEFGGEIVFVEATRMQGERQLILTGSLGSVLQESAQIAFSYIRSQADRFRIQADFFAGSDIHIHIPSGAIPKDGPSAGITIAVALLSLLTGRPARREVALTGELTLSGRILPVSGIREKLLAAQRAGVRTVILPQRNKVDVAGLEADVTAGVDIVLAEDLSQVVDHVLLPDPKDAA